MVDTAREKQADQETHREELGRGLKRGSKILLGAHSHRHTQRCAKVWALTSGRTWRGKSSTSAVWPSAEGVPDTQGASRRLGGFSVLGFKRHSCSHHSLTQLS